MESRSRSVKEWVHSTLGGAVRLPSFQREESWDKKRVRKFLTTLIYKSRPVGVLLVLEASPDKEVFATKPISGFREFGEASEKCTSYLLDGQQRMTALLRSFHDNYDKDTYYIRFIEKSDGCFDLASTKPNLDLEDEDVGVAICPKKAPFYGNPGEEYKNGLFPIRLLNPEDEAAFLSWAQEASARNDNKLIAFISKIRLDLNGKQIPYLSLPSGTDASEAIDVFIEMNTSSVPLSHFDIAVAQFEAQTQERLPDFIEQLQEEVPEVDSIEGKTTRSGGIGNMALLGSCLIQEIRPTFSNFMKLDMRLLRKDWDVFCDGVKGTVELLNELKIYNGKVLPTHVPLRVLPALWREIPKEGDARADAMRIVRAYLWRAFCTPRYGRQANNRLHEDFQRMKELFKNKKFPPADAVFTVKEDFSVPSFRDLVGHGKGALGIITNGILAASIQSGGKDIASGDRYSRANCDSRQKHHIFPKDLLAKKAKGHDPDLALNLMWVSGFTNKTVGAKYPGDYLLDRVKKSRHHDPDGKVRRRLESHLIPADSLMECTESNSGSLEKMYKAFIKERAKMVAAAVEKLCAGDEEI
ncbi:MAG: DUF262 domain-containing protein [Gammaproteobacteria bacterium]|nr:DUF262 domain-containing protein [Gammaproteobacteria bacterium]